MVNVLLTIIIDGYETIKRELEGKGNELEVIEYMKDAVRSMLGSKPRPDFLHEFVPEGHEESPIVTENKNISEEQEQESAILGLPNKMDNLYINTFELFGDSRIFNS